MRAQLVGGVVLFLVAIGCSSKSSTSGPVADAGSGIATDPASGKTYVQNRGCPKCHGDDMSGQLQPLTSPPLATAPPPGVQLYPPNLTPDPDTGIGNWTDDQLKGAIIDGVDNQGLELCPEMKHYKDMSDDEAQGIINYLRSIPAVKKQVPGSICPPLKG